MPTIELLGSQRSPFLRKVRLALLEKNIPFEWNQQPGDRLAKLNPLAKIPTLLVDGQAIYDSKVIVEYLDTINQSPALLPSQPARRVAVKQWESLADGMSDAMVAVNAESKRPQNLQSADAMGAQRGKVERGLAVAAEKFGSGPWCEGGAMSAADLALVSALGYLSFRFPEIDWRSRYPNLAGFYDAMHQRPSVASSIPAP